MTIVVNSLRLAWSPGQRTGMAEMEFVPPLPGGQRVVPIQGLSAGEIGMLAAMTQLPGKLRYDPRTGMIFTEAALT
ncbi:MAG: hypothetical protein KJZ85_12485 [Rhodobacteraceae bacterium]|jgi:hypothetical protein|nr:hypothetical protein [Paracoccaceae bacterium]